MGVRRLWSMGSAFVGMTFFWGFFRYQSFFEVLYPPALCVSLFGATLQAHLYSLVLLATIVALSPLLWHLAMREQVSQRAIGLSAALTGLVGSSLALAAVFGLVPNGMLLVAMPCVAWSFVANYLLWAHWFTRDFGKEKIVLLAASFATSIALGILGRLGSQVVLAMAILTPTMTAIGFCMQDPASTAYTGFSTAKCSDQVRRTPVYVGLYLAFLLVGAIVRGIVDAQGRTGAFSLRWPASVTVAVALLVACVVFWRALVPGGRTGSFSLAVWTALGLLFCGGVFWELADPASGVGGQLVVVARSTLDFALWLVLCSTAAREMLRPEPQISVTFAFVAYGLAVEVVSWLLSYAVVPRLLATGVAGTRSAQEGLMLASLSVLVVLLVVAVGAQQLRGESKESAEVGTASAPGGAPTKMPPAVSALEGHGLSPRELEVTVLYSRGMSVKRISAKLGISPGTVQSYLKCAYRKLNVHSRDELVDVCG